MNIPFCHLKSTSELLLLNNVCKHRLNCYKLQAMVLPCCCLGVMVLKMLLDLNYSEYLCQGINLHILEEPHLSFWAYIFLSELCQSWSCLRADFPSSVMDLHISSFVSTPFFGRLLLLVTEQHRQTVGLIYYLTLSEHIDGPMPLTWSYLDPVGMWPW